MTRFKLKRNMIMAAAMLLTLGIAAAQFPGGTGGNRMGPRQSAIQTHGPGDGSAFHREGEPFRALRILAEYLELSEDQVESIRHLTQATREEARPIHQKIRDLQEQLKAELDSGNPDPATVGSLVIQAHDSREQLRGLALDRNQAILDTLTLEQSAKVNNVVEAARLQPVIRAFHELRLLPPPGADRPGSPPEE